MCGKALPFRRWPLRVLEAEPPTVYYTLTVRQASPLIGGQSPKALFISYRSYLSINFPHAKIPIAINNTMCYPRNGDRSLITGETEVIEFALKNRGTRDKPRGKNDSLFVPGVLPVSRRFTRSQAEWNETIRPPIANCSRDTLPRPAFPSFSSRATRHSSLISSSHTVSCRERAQ